ncbi:metal ABC transporter permease [uncultured Helicobacter sp.]|uniref:metal ABC transporter permease n=1 Tax=uncultured Helicobacter sp. TaxID=175537 RepID=UPI0027DD6747|nr:metal ABC transporter permease [uncultured Helicobacter sp.]
MDFFASYFVQNALIASFFLSISAGIIGSIIVANKNVFMAGGVAHSAFGGVGVALFFGVNALFGAMIAAILMSLFMVYASFKHSGRLDTFIAAFWAFGMAVGIIFIDMASGYKINIESYLFGSLIFTTRQDLWFIIGFDIVLVCLVAMYYREILGILYDQEFCTLKNLKTHFFITMIFVLSSIGIVLGMRSGGLVLIISIVSIPAYIAMMMTRNFKWQLVVSTLLCLVFMWVGFFISYYYELASGACIVLCAMGAFIVAMCIKSLMQRIRYE